ncbi:hypothetical protein F4778DRAFT_312205 [Xylariomycetidae sp. FL2044]|nr:hypothetical protein F4778DRAFT_312205 [Xylariomycetidae sp. FL2044]
MNPGSGVECPFEISDPPSYVTVATYPWPLYPKLSSFFLLVLVLCESSRLQRARKMEIPAVSAFKLRGWGISIVGTAIAIGIG